jgi:hypothetical protein
METTRPHGRLADMSDIIQFLDVVAPGDRPAASSSLQLSWYIR